MILSPTTNNYKTIKSYTNGFTNIKKFVKLLHTNKGYNFKRYNFMYPIRFKIVLFLFIMREQNSIYKYKIPENCKMRYDTDKIIITCPFHGDFSQRIIKHISGNGCPKCASNIRLTNEEFDSRLKLIDKSLIRLDEYISMEHGLDIKCMRCGDIFNKTPNILLYGNSGCSVCRSKESKGSLEISHQLNLFKVRYIKEYRFKDIARMPFDFYLPDYNICIEYDGEQHFTYNNPFSSLVGNTIKNDQIKNNFCAKNNIKLIRIPYTSYKDIRLIIVTIKDNNEKI